MKHIRRCLRIHLLQSNKELVEVVKTAQLSLVSVGKNAFYTTIRDRIFWMYWILADTLLDDNEMMTSYVESLSPIPIF